MTRLRSLALSGVAVLALLAVSAPPIGGVDAVFTSGATLGAQSVSTATVSPLTGADASRGADGATHVAWDAPAGDPAYRVSRTVGDVTTALAPTISTGAGRTGFSDDLVEDADMITATPTAIGSGDAAACAVVGGAAYCWGPNFSGQVGDGTITRRAVPTRVVGMEGRTVTAVSGGSDTTCALADGSVFCWGGNYFGQVGDGTMTDRRVAQAVTGLGGQTIVAIDVGGEHACAVAATGALFCWGSNMTGQLGSSYGDAPYQTTAVAVPGLTGITQVAVGGRFTCALTDARAVYCWGDNSSGQLALNSVGGVVPTPTPVAGLTARSIHAGRDFVCSVIPTGLGVQCWGDNDFGQLGNGSTVDSPRPVAGFAGEVSTLETGIRHACVTLRVGGARCWGGNDNGQLGDGTTTHRTWAVAVARLGFRGVTSLSATEYTTCALLGDVVECWGGAGGGQIGDGSVHDGVVPPTPIWNGNFPREARCAAGWDLAGADRCIPGPDIAVRYRIDHTVAGWSPPAGLSVTAPYRAP